MRPVDRRVVPSHGQLGQIAGKNIKEVKDFVKRTYQIGSSDRIIVNYSHSDPPYRLYDVEVDLASARAKHAIHSQCTPRQLKVLSLLGKPVHYAKGASRAGERMPNDTFED